MSSHTIESRRSPPYGWILAVVAVLLVLLALTSCSGVDPATAASIGSAAGAGMLAWSTSLLEAGTISPEQHEVFMAGLNALGDEIVTAKAIGYGGGGVAVAAVGGKPAVRIAASVGGAILRALTTSPRKPA